MWVRTLKITFKNELMKNSIKTDMASKVDLTEGMMLSYRVKVSANVVLVNHFFPSEQAIKDFNAKLKPVREQIISMGQRSRSMMARCGRSRWPGMSPSTC